MATTTCNSDSGAKKNTKENKLSGGSFSGDGQRSGRATPGNNRSSSSWAEDSSRTFPSVNDTDEFPTLGEPSFRNKSTFERSVPYKKYLVIKHKDPKRRITDVSPIEMEKGLTHRLGKDQKYKVSRLRSGLLLIEVDRKELYDKLMQTSKLNNIPVKVEEHSTLNISKGVIFCDNIRDMSDEQLQEYLKPQEVKEVYRIQKKLGDKTDPTDLFIITFNKPVLPSNIKIGYLNIKVSIYIPNPRRCYNCQRFGHGKNTCRNHTVCAKCGETGHEFDDCNNEQHCCNCGKNHPASSRQCPVWQLEKKIMDLKLKKNLTYKEARNGVYSQNPDLVAQVPKLQKIQDEAQPLYSNKASPTAMTPGLQQFLYNQQNQIANLTRQVDTLVALLRQQMINSTEMIPSQQISQNDSQNENSQLMETEDDSQGIKRLNRSVSSDDDSSSETLVEIGLPNLARQSSAKRTKPDDALSSNKEGPSGGKGPTSPANLSTPDDTSSGSGENTPIVAVDSNADSNVVDSDSGKSTDGERESSLNTGKQEVPADNSSRGQRTKSLDRDAGSSRQRSRSPLNKKKSKNKGGNKLSPKNIYERIKRPK